MNTNGKIIMAAAATLALSACHQPRPMQAPNPFGGETWYIDACNGAPTSTGQPYIITIDKNFDIHKPGVTITGHARGNTGKSHKHNTPLDIVTMIGANSAGTIQIVLADPTLHFNTEKVIVGASPDAPNQFCGVTLDSAADPRWVSFTVHPDQHGAISAPYNLALLADPQGTFKDPLPFIIDPWVDNNGLVKASQ